MEDNLLLQIISLGTIFILIFCVVFLVLEVFKIKNPFKEYFMKNQLETVFLISLFGTVGSLSLSIYFGLVPCELCWYQRIFLFGIPIISLIALYRKDISARLYVFALSLIGILFAAYHALLQSNLLKEDSVFCNPSSVSDCATSYFTYFNFVTIPVISLSVFALLLIVSFPYSKKE